MIKVSIIIPVFNGSNYLKYAVESALNQVYSNIEVIVVNDGSSDGGQTRDIALSFGDKIRYFEKPNGGVASALNFGIQHMSGQYFSWLSHDDTYEPHKVASQIEVFSEQGFDDNSIVFSNYSLIDTKGDEVVKVYLDFPLFWFKNQYALFRGSLNGCTLLVPKSAFDKVGLFDENLKFAQDYDFWYRASKHFRFHHLPRSLVNTRQHPNQDSSANSSKSNEEADKLWLKMITELSEDERQLLEETPRKFYLGMVKFLENTPYKKAKEYCVEKLKASSSGSSDEIISVIIPFYNDSEEVIDAANSVLNQTYKNIEIVLVDDGSLSVSQRLKDFCELKGIVLHSLPENMGPAHARNYGMSIAKGTYFAFLDSDDTFLPHKIQVQVDSMKETGSYFSHTSYIKSRGGVQNIVESGKLNGFVISDIISSCDIATPTVMIHRFVYEEGFTFCEEYKFGEDVCAWITLCKKYSLLGVLEALTVVNVVADSAINSLYKNEKGLRNIVNFILKDDELKPFYAETGKLMYDLGTLNGFREKNRLGRLGLILRYVRSLIPSFR